LEAGKMILADLSRAVIEGNDELAEKLTREALEQGIPARRIYQEALIPAMEVVGKKMQSGEYYIPEVLLSADTMKEATEILKPLITKSGGVKAIGKVVIGTVAGDLHDIGKNLVAIMLEGAGFEVHDLGVDNTPDKFIAAVEEINPDIVGLSALLSITMLSMKDIIKSLEKAGYRKRVRVMVGGAPLSQSYAAEIGADGYARDAGGAVELAKSLMKSGGM
jgi:5-methyltetrahydrofolate--homocysteine methyltransferase